MKLHWLIRSYLSALMPGIVDGDGAADRGDTFTPTDDDDGDDKVVDKAADDTKGAADKTDDADAEKGDEKGADDADKGKDKGKGKDTRMPLARHKEILEREREHRRALEAEVANFKKGAVVADTNKEIGDAETKLSDLEVEYTGLMADNKPAEAAKKMSEIRQLERSISDKKLAMATQASEARAYERARYDATLERLEAAYPAINEDHDDYDKEKAAEVIELRDGFFASGRYSRADALQKAAKVLLGAATSRQKAAVETEVRVDKDDVDKAKGDEVRKDRAVAARAKAAGADGKQPPKTGDVGIDSDKMGGGLTAKAVMGMKQDEFAKLDDKTLSRLRGDEVTA